MKNNGENNNPWALIVFNRKQDLIVSFFRTIRLIKVVDSNVMVYSLSKQELGDILYVEGFTPLIHFLQTRFHNGWLISKDGADRRHFNDFNRMVENAKEKGAI